MKTCLKYGWKLITLVVILTMIAACTPAATPTPLVVEKTVQVLQTVMVPGTPQVVEKLITPTPEMPTVGGTLKFHQPQEPTTLDNSIIGGDLGYNIIRLIGSTLMEFDSNGNLVGYLAESWETSADKLTWTYKIKKGVKFHNGDPLTAKDFVYTFDRAPSLTGGYLKGQVLPRIAKYEAVDDYTLRITLKKPYFSFLNDLAISNTQPISKRAVEAAGADYARKPVGVGPYIFKEWVKGQKVVLERNPDFNWGPAFAHAGPFYIQTIEFLILPEAATVIASLEAGQMDLANIEPGSVARFKDNKNFNLTQGTQAGIGPYVGFNYQAKPFDDAKLRQAMSMAVDRASLIKVAAAGNAVPLLGPISSRVVGYWPGVEYLGVNNSLAKAKTLLKEAGYTDTNNDGILEKDGKPLKVSTKFDSGNATAVKTAQVLKEQYKALGLDLDLQQMEAGQLFADLQAGKFEVIVYSLGFPTADLLGIMFRSTGAMNVGKFKDTAFDDMVVQMEGSTSLEDYQKNAAELQKYIIEKSLIVPLFTATETTLASKRIKGLSFSKAGDPRYATLLYDAYLGK